MTKIPIGGLRLETDMIQTAIRRMLQTQAGSRYLRVTASYIENDEDRMARAMSAYPVQALGLGAKNQSP